jgi:hypothetical protein
MTTFWKILPFLIKLLTAIVGVSGAAANVALTQVGDGAPASEWWKVLAWGVPGLVGAVTTVTHHYNSNKEALATPPPAGSNLEYLGRVGADLIQGGDAENLKKVGELSTALYTKGRVTKQMQQFHP